MFLTNGLTNLKRDGVMEFAYTAPTQLKKSNLSVLTPDVLYTTLNNVILQRHVDAEV